MKIFILFLTLFFCTEIKVYAQGEVNKLPALSDIEQSIVGKWKLSTDIDWGEYKNNFVFNFEFKPDHTVIIEQTSNSNVTGISYRVVSSSWILKEQTILMKDVYRNDITPKDKKQGSFDTAVIDMEIEVKKGFFGGTFLRHESFKADLEKISM